MQLGLVSALLPELSLDELLKFVAAEGLSCVELACWPVGKAERKYAGVTHLDVTDFTPTMADEVRALAEKHGVAISALGYYPNMLHPDAAVREACVAHFKKVMVATKRLGLETTTGFVGRDWTRDIDDNWPLFLEVWRPLIQFAEDQGVRVAIENCPMRFTRDEWPGGKNLMTTPAIWRRAFNDIPSPNFGLNFDPSHFALQFMEPASALMEFRDKLFHMHAKDVRIDRNRLNEVGVFAHPLEWHQPRLPGYGEIDWAHYMGSVMETGYAGPVCIEVEDGTFGSTLEGRCRAVRVARQMMAPYFA
ncbi:MAG: sugar phosphate isomerase/epimerase [Verrucomicrobiales bacterium]|nr:sugar phosphate isomerase/epimerase [Verrucomicrobiales bacterium]